jgi:sorbitol-specific phosphotransferase system component IIBC
MIKIAFVSLYIGIIAVSGFTDIIYLTLLPEDTR